MRLALLTTNANDKNSFPSMSRSKLSLLIGRPDVKKLAWKIRNAAISREEIWRFKKIHGTRQEIWCLPPGHPTCDQTVYDSNANARSNLKDFNVNMIIKFKMMIINI